MSTQEVKQAVEALQKTFHDFKEANDERLEQLEKTGRNDPLLAKKVDKINDHVGEMMNAVREAEQKSHERTDELEAKLNRKGLAGSKEDKDFRADAETFFAGKTNVARAKVSEDDVEAYSAYKPNFVNWVRYGDGSHHMTQEVKATLSVGSDPDGGYWVPTEMSSDIKRRIFETSEMRQVASVMSITTDSVEFPTDTNEATSGGWVGETASRSATDTPQVGQQRIYVREQYAMPEVTQKLLDMASIDIEGWLNGKIAGIISRTENTAFVSGAGVDRPRGFLDYKDAAVTTDDDSRSWGVLQYQFTGASAAFPTGTGTPGASDPDVLLDTISKLKPVYRAGAQWFMNRATEAAVRKLKDRDGRYLVNFGNIQDGAVGFNLFGFPIFTMEDMPDIAADSFSIAYGNMATAYQIVDGRGLRVLRDPFTNKPFVRFYTTKWTGGDVVNFDALKLVKFGTS